ncbi:hypothetical protein V1264_024019 [Littorina saxatilis]
MEESLYEDQLVPPAGVSALVNSPTTDTLDSVALETSPTDDQDLGEEELLPDNQQGNEVPLRDSRLTGLSFASPADISIDLNSSVIPSATETQAMFSMDSHPLAAGFGDTASRRNQNISSYFATEGTADNIFDSLGGAEGSFAEMKSVQENVFDEIITTTTGVTMPEEPPAHTDELQAEETEEVDGEMEPDVTHIRHREHKISTSEPETVGFEGVEEGSMETPAIADLTEKEDEFESFTAAEGSGVIQHTGLVERSDSLPHAPATIANAEQPGGKVEEIGGMVHGLSLTGPTVGTTPTQMSPLHTPLHQPQPQKSASEPPPFDPQTSGPGSPFHVPDSGPHSDNFPSFGEVGAADDIFTTSLSVSDTDRRYDAWIPSDATRHTLITMATSPSGSFNPAVEQLSSPGVLNSEPQGDPVRDLVYRYMGEQEAIRRQVLTADSVSHDPEGLKQLVESGCLRAAVDLTGRLLTNGGQGESNFGQATQHTPQMLQLWFCRFALMVKLRLYEMAESEMRAFQNLDTPDLYFEFYPQRFPGRRGSMVCFAMRLLHADLPHLNGRSQETLDRLYYILAVVRKIVNNLDSEVCEDGSAAHLSADSRRLSKDLWMEREGQVMYNIASVLLSVRDYQAALALYNTLLDKDVTRRAELLTGISRIHLQMGNVTKANEIHTEVEKLMTKGDNVSACRNAMNKGLSAMCINNFSEAYNFFKTAVQLDPNDTNAVNNMAVCSLYLGRLKDALNTLEAIVHSDPARNLHEGILFNLCTLYELESSRALHKKQAVLDLVSKHKGDGFPIACLKMA